MPPSPASADSRILILDFGAQYSQLIARRVREGHVYCELHPADLKLAGAFSSNSNALGVAVGGDFAAVALGTAGVDVFDISNIEVPVLLGRVATGNAHDVTIDGDEETHRQLSDRQCVLAGNVADEDAEFGRLRRVDRVGAGAGSNDQRELIGPVECLGGDFGGANDEHFDPTELVAEVVSGQIALHRDLVAGVLEAGDRRRGERIG